MYRLPRPSSSGGFRTTTVIIIVNRRNTIITQKGTICPSSYQIIPKSVMKFDLSLRFIAFIDDQPVEKPPFAFFNFFSFSFFFFLNFFLFIPFPSIHVLFLFLISTPPKITLLHL